MNKFFKSMTKEEKPVTFGDGTQSRNFICVKDAAEVARIVKSKGKSGELYHVGTGVATSFNGIS